MAARVADITVLLEVKVPQVVLKYDSDVPLEEAAVNWVSTHPLHVLVSYYDTDVADVQVARSQSNTDRTETA